MEMENLQTGGNNVLNICDNETNVPNSLALPDNATNICGICK